ncbi:MAG: MBL fold metallo-hydrolase [Christensenellaceae bacterium]|jgi:L-ascorbate metabolism protein UlaG (beta-lactamase superfamily)|nr:MBL fold metallo-hydrolase [Christensenellaceae bacterium]
MSKLYYQGHGSFRLTTDSGRVIYVDPYAGTGYDLKADIILVSHEHFDHIEIKKCTGHENAQVFTYKTALTNGVYKKLQYENIEIQAVPAGGNKNHDISKCVGFLITIDDLKIYASGDTSKVDFMFELSKLNLDYAIFCGDGIYNMDLEEAADCARIVNAKHNIIIHLKPGELFDKKRAQAWTAPNKIIIEPNQEIIL